jgi:exonuclease SbcD
MPLRIIATADLHLGQSGPIQQAPAEIQEERISDGIRSLRFVASRVIEESADFLVICGDIFHTPKPSAPIFNRFAEVVGKLSEKGIQTVVVAGNHDLPRMAGGEPYLSALREVRAPGFWFLDKPCDLVLKGEHSGQKVRFVSVPYLHLASPEEDKRREEIQRILDQLLSKKEKCFTIVLGHLVAEGSSLGILKELITYPEPVIQRKALLREDVDFVLLGHLHRHQVIDGKIIYPGSPERMSFSEEKEQKGFVEVYEEEGELHNKFHQINARPLLTYPKDGYIMLSESPTPTDELLRVLEGVEVPNGAIMKLRVKLGHKQSLDWLRILDRLREKGALYADLDFSKELAEKPSTTEPSLNLKEQLRRFILRDSEIPKRVARLAIREGIRIIDEVAEGL